jgi:UDP-glucose 4-epimerase
VPVSYVVRILTAAMEQDWERSTAVAFNLGTGRAETNGEVAATVQRVLREHGYALRIDWSDPIAPGEAETIVLDMKQTSRTFGLPVPSREETVAAIEEATRYWLGCAE